MNGAGTTGRSIDQAGIVAGLIAAKLGVDADGPIGRRLSAYCKAASTTALAAARIAVAQPGVHPDLRDFYDAATNRETYFFRDRRQLAAALSALSAEPVAIGATTAIWSAGCASGEETYSLAILARTALGPGRGVSVLGTDVAPAAIARAEVGRYRTGPLSACRNVGTDMNGVLPPDGPDHRIVAPGVRALALFRTHNLLDGPVERSRFDLIVCRNVVLYMTDAARRTALRNLAAAARPGGLLVLGTGDIADYANMIDAGFAPVEIDGVMMFRREGT